MLGENPTFLHSTLRMAPTDGACNVYHWSILGERTLFVPLQVQPARDQRAECMDAPDLRAAASRQFLVLSNPRAVSVSPPGIEKSSRFSTREKKLHF